MHTHHKPLPVILDRLQHALATKGQPVTRSDAMAIAASAFGYRSANELAAAAKARSIELPRATRHPTGGLDLGDGQRLVVAIDPLSGAPFGVDESFLEQICAEERRESAVPTPYGHLVDISALLDNEPARDAEARPLPSDLSLSELMRAVRALLDSASTEGSTTIVPTTKLEALTAALAQAKATPWSSDNSTNTMAVCPATAHTDDWVFKVDFDASNWLRLAPIEAIVALAKCGWGGDYAADRVAEDYVDQDTSGRMERLLAHTLESQETANPVGFECRINKDRALAFLARERRSAFTAVLRNAAHPAPVEALLTMEDDGGWVLTPMDEGCLLNQIPGCGIVVDSDCDRQVALEACKKFVGDDTIIHIAGDGL
jgi:hypothetical protein